MADFRTDPKNKNDTNEANLSRVFADSAIEASAARMIEDLINAEPRRPLTILQLDMDKSKEIRSCGIDVKLAVLEEIGKLLKQYESESCIVIPHGTRDDVTIICIGMWDPKEETAFTSSVLQMLERTPVGAQLEQGPFHVTYSAGIASYPATANTAAQLLELADGAVRWAKDHGRHSYAAAETGYHYTQEGAVDWERYRRLRQISANTGKPVDELVREGYGLLFQKHAALYRFCEQEEEATLDRHNKRRNG